MPDGEKNRPFGEVDRHKLIEVNEALRGLHKVLIGTVRSEYEREHGPIAGSGALLRLLMEDPFFSWLRPMSKAMVEMDELLEEAMPLEPIRIAGLRERIEGMIASPRYLNFLQSSPDVVMGHTALRKALGELR
ncbi:MAG: hypothetical protein LLH30_05060 [Candidatus Manganitrophus sp. SA1]|nr:hypothetical protein [Candidatus Manganitrophus morganii]